MISIVGLVVVMAAVFGVFVLHGGDLTPIIHAAPAELASIGGAAIGAMHHIGARWRQGGRYLQPQAPLGLGCRG